jgi:GWxTD domain-containing protein
MRLLPLALVLSAFQSAPERATQPTFLGQGDGTLTILSAPENVPLEFYTIRCVSAGSGAATFSVMRSGREANPPDMTVGESYEEAERHVSLRIDAGEKLFSVGDTFSFVTYPHLDALDDLFDRWVNQYVEWIISREEKAVFERLPTPSDKLLFMETFWSRRDVHPETPENEAREEHQRRFAYATQHFGAGIPGWATDRGKIYILLGPPSAITRAPAGRNAFERPSEVWTYNNAPNPRLPASFDIGFVDFSATGRYEIVSAENLDLLAPLRTNLGWAHSELDALGFLRDGGSYMDPISGARTELDPEHMVTDQFDFQRNLQEVARIPARTLPPLREMTEARAEFPSMPLSTMAAYFPLDEASARVPITVSVPYARLTPRPSEDGEGYDFQADLLVRVTPESPESETTEPAPIEERLEIRIAESELQDYRASHLVYEAQATLGPGRYRIDALIRDNPSGALGRASTSIEVPPLTNEGLSLSSLLLASGAIETTPPSPETTRAPFQFGGLRLVPSVGGKFSQQSTLTAYLQASGYPLDPQDARARLRVDFFIIKDGRLFSKVAPSYHRPTNRSSVAIKSEVSLKALPPGDYTLRARVTDEIANESEERNADFSVTLP